MRGLEGMLFTVGVPMALVGSFGLARTLLVLIGRLKGPLLLAALDGFGGLDPTRWKVFEASTWDFLP